MDNFDFKKYLAEGRIHADHDLINEKKEDSKKGNKEEQKRMEGAIRDNEIHIDKLNKDKKADKKKLAKLKADEPKDVKEAQGYNDKLDDSEGAKHGKKKQDMKQRRADSENMEKAKGKRKYSGDKSMDEAEINENIGQGDALISNGKEGEGAEDVIIKYTDVEAYPDKPRNDGTFSIALKAERIDGEKFQGEDEITVYFMINPEKTKIIEPRIVKGDGRGDFNFKPEMKEYGETLKFINDNYKDVSEGYGKKYEEDDIDSVKEEMPSKMKLSELKAKIREDILSTLNEDEDVDVDVDFEDEVNVDAEGDDIEIERPAVKAKVQVGLSPEEEIVQDSLKAAMDAADALGNDKLADQIGNTITFFTREYVVGRNSD